MWGKILVNTKRERNSETEEEEEEEERSRRKEREREREREKEREREIVNIMKQNDCIKDTPKWFVARSDSVKLDFFFLLVDFICDFFPFWIETLRYGEGGQGEKRCLF